MAFKMKNPCWDKYEMVGTKKKGGKTVPNCVKSSAMKNYKKGYYNDSPKKKCMCSKCK